MGADIFELEGNTALYEVLGLSTAASDKEIRHAYYKLAVLYHPDKNPDGSEIFKEIAFAHSILSDPEQRRMYDRKTLRSQLVGMAREYDPTMDPNVQLSPEDLRKFVEKIREKHLTKAKSLSDFEQRREEEMRRRAEYDAKNPAVKEEYERQRTRRLQGRRPALTDQRSNPSQSLTVDLMHRTSAELVRELQEEERRRLYGERSQTAVQTRSVALPTIKHTMMSKFRADHAESGVPTRTLAITLRNAQLKSSLPFVSNQGPSYCDDIEQKVRECANFDYLTFVERGMVDGGVMEGAILADALTHYDQNN